MNNQRRAALKKLIGQANDLAMEIQNLREQVEAIKDEEQEAFDNMPESLQDGDKGQAMQAAIDALDSAEQDLDGMSFDDIENNLEEAQA